MQLTTNTDLARNIIARYTTFLSIAASGAELTFLTLPSLEQPQAAVFLNQQQELRHIYHCIEQNTMVSVNLNLQFLNRMMTQAVRQFSTEARRAASMVERPALPQRPAQTQMLRTGALPAPTLLREVQQRTAPGQRPDLKKTDRMASDPARMRVPGYTVAAPPKVQLASPSTGSLPDAALPQGLPRVTAQGDFVSAQHAAEKNRPLPSVQGAKRLPLIQKTAWLPRSTDKSTSGGVPLTAPHNQHTAQTTLKTSETQQRTEILRPAMKAAAPLAAPAAAPLAARAAGPIAAPAAAPLAAPAAGPLVFPAAAPPRQPPSESPAAQQKTGILRPAMKAEAPLAAPAAAPPRRTAFKAPAAQQRIDPLRAAAQAGAPLAAPAAGPLVFPAAAPPGRTAFKAPAAQQRTEILRPAMKAEAPPAAPAAGPLVFPAAVLPGQTDFKAPAAQQRIDPLRAATQAGAPLASPAALPGRIAFKAPAKLQRTAPLRAAMQARAPLAAPTAALPGRIAFQAPAKSQRTAPLRAAMQAPIAPAKRQTAPLPPPAHREPYPAVQSPIANSARRLPASTIPKRAGTPNSAAKNLAQPLISGRLMAPQSEPSFAPPPNALPLPSFGISARTDAPAPRVLRTEPQQKKNAEAADDSMDIPTIQVKKTETQETQKESIRQNVAVNMPQEHPAQTLFSAPQEALAEAELTRLTDKVYRAIESRLRSEKMRRGMW